MRGIKSRASICIKRQKAKMTTEDDERRRKQREQSKRNSLIVNITVERENVKLTVLHAQPQRFLYRNPPLLLT